MGRDHDPGGSGKAPIGGDLVIPVAAVLFTLYYFYSIKDSPWTAQVSAFFNGSILIALCAAFIIAVARRVAKQKASLGFDALVEPIEIAPKRGALFLLTVAYIACISWAGFTITTFAFLVLGMMLLSGRERGNGRVILILSGILAVGGYLLFVVAFERNFPEGPFERAFEAAMKAAGGG